MKPRDNDNTSMRTIACTFVFLTTNDPVRPLAATRQVFARSERKSFNPHSHPQPQARTIARSARSLSPKSIEQKPLFLLFSPVQFFSALIWNRSKRREQRNFLRTQYQSETLRIIPRDRMIFIARVDRKQSGDEPSPSKGRPHKLAQDTKL